MIKNEQYRWKYQHDVMIFLGKEGNWNQFALLSDPHTVWCEVLDEQLNEIEPLA